MGSIMKPKRNFLTFFIASLLLSTLACSIFIGGPEYPSELVPASADEVSTMQTQIAQSFLDGAQSGVVTFQITEKQLTSYLALKIQGQVDPPFTEPQILLRNGQMQMYGKVNQGYFTANMLITMNIGIDPTTGQPSITIASADFGPVDAPEGINNAISTVIDEAFTGSFGPVATGLRIETLSIADGVMTITGRIK
jgi:hypothetical protein